MRGSIERRGENSFRLVISGGLDGSGKQNKQTRLFKSDANMTEAQKQKAANEALALFIADLKKGNGAQSQGMTVAKLWAYWLEHYAETNLEQTTVEYYKNMWPRINKAIGHMRIDRIKPEHIQAFMKKLGEPGIKKIQQKKNASPEEKEKPPAKLSPVTIRKYHAVISGMFSKAVKWRFMDYNPCDHTEAPKAQQNQKQIYDLETTGKFLESLDGEETRHQLMILLALSAGLRREEIFGLRWCDIDENIISIRQARVVVGSQIITKTPKTASSMRSVSIPAELVALIKKHSAEEAAKRLKKGAEWKGKDKADDDLIFTTWDGSDLHPQSMNNFLRRFCIEHDFPTIQPHAFRHMAGTFLIASGTDIRTLSGKMGHSRTSITMNIYAHLLKSAESETANTMTNILATCRQQAKDAKETKKAPAK